MSSSSVLKQFNCSLVEAVDESLLALGEVVRRSIYQYVERNHQVEREDIPEKLEAFHKCLQGIFGVATNVIERLMAKRLYSKLGLSFESHENWTLVDYVNHAKKVKGM